MRSAHPPMHSSALSAALSCAIVALWPAAPRAASPPPARAAKAMVVSAHPDATQAGLTSLKRGGNACDAAAATAFAISVVEPYSAGVGGGGFALVYQRRGGEVLALDFRERAPLAAHRDLYLDDQGAVVPGASTTGHRAAAVPGTVAGLAALVERCGALTLADALAPAIELAANGVVVTPTFEGALRYRLEELRADPGARATFLKDDEPYAAGELLVQRDLADTLRLIERHGPDVFYRGELAQDLVGDMAESGGLIAREDLASYQPVWRAPLRGSYRGYQVVSMPLPSSGGLVLLEVLGLLERDASAARPYRDARSLHTYIEASRRAYHDRARAMGDPAFLRAPAAGLLAPQRLQTLYRGIDPRRRTPSSALGPLSAPDKVGGSTSHLCVVDPAGNAVSLTFTVNTVFGAAVVVPGTGVLLNNEMDDFSIKPGAPNHYGLVGGEANAIAPTKIPLSSMTPTFVFEQGALRLAVGSPGGSTIITTVLQIVTGVVDHGMDVGAAVAAPRVHHQYLPDEVYYEPRGLEPETRRALFHRGHTLVERRDWGNAMAIQVLPDGTLLGAADPRGEGLAAGY